MEFQRENPKCRFAIPDRPTVRQQMEYFGLASRSNEKDMFIRYWNGARALIIPPSWECEIVALDADLDSITDPRATEVMLWAGTQVMIYFSKLEELQKN